MILPTTIRSGCGSWERPLAAPAPHNFYFGAQTRLSAARETRPENGPLAPAGRRAPEACLCGAIVPGAENTRRGGGALARAGRGESGPALPGRGRGRRALPARGAGGRTRQLRAGRRRDGAGCAEPGKGTRHPSGARARPPAPGSAAPVAPAPCSASVATGGPQNPGRNRARTGSGRRKNLERPAGSEGASAAGPARGSHTRPAARCPGYQARVGCPSGLGGRASSEGAARPAAAGNLWIVSRPPPFLEKSCFPDFHDIGLLKLEGLRHHFRGGERCAKCPGSGFGPVPGPPPAEHTHLRRVFRTRVGARSPKSTHSARIQRSIQKWTRPQDLAFCKGKACIKLKPATPGRPGVGCASTYLQVSICHTGLKGGVHLSSSPGAQQS